MPLEAGEYLARGGLAFKRLSTGEVRVRFLRQFTSEELGILSSDDWHNITQTVN